MNENGRDLAIAVPRLDQRPVSGRAQQEQHPLGGLETKFQLVRDFVAEIVKGLTTGLYLFGEGGIGKSYTVITELVRLQADYKVYNSRMTGRGLYNGLEKFPDSIHVLEDMEALFRDRGAQGVLRSVLWGQRTDKGNGPMERTVTWSTYKLEHSFIFTGGIILIANKPLATLPELDALKTRIACVHLRATEGELIALMRGVAMQGFEHDGQVIESSECLAVCEFIITESRSLHRSLDMRLLTNSFLDFLAWQDCHTGCHWMDMVATRLKERPTTFAAKPDLGTRAERKQRELEVAREVAEATPDRHERLRLWIERTGKSEPTLYRRLQELDWV